MKIINANPFVVGVGLVCLVAGGANAATIPGLYNTGVDNLGVTLADGAIDPHYLLISSVDSSFPGPDAVVVNAGYPIAPNGPWVANDSQSKWISPRADGGTEPNGLYTYELTFDLTGLDPTNAHITGMASADDAVSVSLNGGAAQTLPGTYTSYSPFAFDSGFVAGVNTVDFQVANLYGYPTGLRVDIQGTDVPEPGAYALLGGLGVTGLGLLRRRRSRK